MSRKNFFLSVCVVLFSISTSSFAQLSEKTRDWQDSKVVSQNGQKKDPFDSLPSVIKKMMKKGSGVTYLDSFSTESGMKGYVLASNNGERRIFYVPADEKVAILGLMFDGNMENLTARHQKKYMNLLQFNDGLKGPSVPFANPFFAAQELALNALFDEGSPTAMPLYLFVDPVSSDFDKLYKATRGKVNSLHLVWIAVPGANTDTTFDATIAIMASKNRAEAAKEYLSLSESDRKTLMSNKVNLKFLNRLPESKYVDSVKKALTDGYAFRKSQSTERTTWLTYQTVDKETVLEFGIPTAAIWKDIEKAVQWHASLLPKPKK